jgi:hypothetical protein
MDGFGDMLGGLGDLIGGIFGGEAGVEGAMGLAEFLSPEGREREAAPYIVYERYLCGAPRQLHINDR